MEKKGSDTDSKQSARNHDSKQSDEKIENVVPVVDNNLTYTSVQHLMTPQKNHLGTYLSFSKQRATI